MGRCRVLLALCLAVFACSKPTVEPPLPHGKKGAALAPPTFRQVSIDPSSVGLAGAVGEIVAGPGGTLAWVKNGPNATDWQAFPGTSGGGLSTVHVTTPISGDGSALTPVALAAATDSVDGYMTSADHVTFGSKLASVTADSPLSGSGTSGSHLVLGTVGLANGGTGQTTANAAINALTTLTTGQQVKVLTSETGVAKEFVVQTSGSSDSPTIDGKTGAGAGTSRGTIRWGGADNTINISPAGTGLLWGPLEAQVLFSWTGSTMAWFGGTRVAKQVVGNSLTDNTSGGTAGTLSTFAGTTYATDASIIMGNEHQLAIKIAALESALLNYNLVSH